MINRFSRLNRINSGTKAAIIAGLICFIVYLPSLTCGFVNLDDYDFVVNNLMIRHLDSDLLSWAFTKPRDLWIPFTWMSFAIEYHFWGLNPSAYHLTNILLHSINTVLVVLICDLAFRLRSRSLPGSLDSKQVWTWILIFVGLLFGIHPLRVESVTWITERKDVLNGIFAFSSVFCYLKFVEARREPIQRMNQTIFYSLSYILFCFSLMAKPVSIVLPLLLLLADISPLGRFRRGEIVKLFVEKVPFLLTSLLLALVTLKTATNKDLFVSYDIFPFPERVVVSGYALFEYIRLQVFPVGISPFHPIPNPIPLSSNIMALAAYSAVFLSILFTRKRAWPAVVCAAYILPLTPVLPFLQNGAQAFASRYTYLPSLVICVAAVYIISFIYQKFTESGADRMRHLLTSILAIILICYGSLTLYLIPVWKDTESLWSRVILIGQVARAYEERGVYYLQNGKYEAAVNDLTRALEIDTQQGMPYLYNYYAFLGDAYSRLGRLEEALTNISIAISQFPHPSYYYLRAMIYDSMGRMEESNADLVRSCGDKSPIVWRFDQ